MPAISRRLALPPRSGRPPVIPPSSPRQWRSARTPAGRTCCSTVTTMCSRSIRSIFGIVRPFEPAVTSHADGRKIIVARGAQDDKGQLMTFVEACRAWQSVDRLAAGRRDHRDRGRRGNRIEEFRAVSRSAARRTSRPISRWSATPACGIPTTPAITTSLRGLLYDEVRIKAANRDLHSGIFGGGAQNPIRVLTRILGGLHDENGRITIPGFYDGVKDLPADILRAVGQAQPDRGVLSQADRTFDPRRRKRPLADRAGLLAPDLRHQWHHRRLYRRGLEDGDSGGSLRQGLVPPGGGAGAGKDPQGVSRLRQRARCPGIAGSNSPIIPARRPSRSTGT